MDIRYTNIGTKSTPHFKNDISPKLIQRLLVLIGHTNDTFLISEDNGLICVNLQGEVIFVRSLVEFYQTKIKTIIGTISTDQMYGVKVLQNVLSLLSNKTSESDVLQESVLFLRLLVIPLINSLKPDILTRMVQGCLRRVLKHSENLGYYELKRDRCLSKSSFINMNREFGMVKYHLDECGVIFHVSKRKLENLYERLQIFMEYTNVFLNDVSELVAFLKKHNETDLHHSLYTDTCIQITAYVKLYTTIALVRDIILHYMVSIVKVNFTENVKAIADAINDEIAENTLRSANILEFMECCRPCHVMTVSLLEDDEIVQWAMRTSSLKMKRVSINGVVMLLTPYLSPAHPGNESLQINNLNGMWIRNHLLGEIEWTDRPDRYSYFLFEEVRKESNVYKIRLVYTHTLFLTVQCLDDSNSRISFQNEELMHDNDILWKVIPVFLGPLLECSDDDAVIISPVLYPHTHLLVKRTRYGHRLGLSAGHPGDRAYWKLSKPISKPYQENSCWKRKDTLTGYKTSYLNVGQLKLKLNSVDE